MIKFGTLRLTIPFWGIALRAAALIVLATAGCEALVRIPLIQAQFLLPILTGHYELGAKEFLAERLYQTNGRIDPAAPGTAGTGLHRASSGIDCFFIGSSIVGRGVIPEEFSRAYQARTGQPITCFNFGLDTLTFKGARTLTQILVKRYHPRLIIFGVHFENFTMSDANKFDLDTAWARNQLGELDLEGWMESNLLVYRDTLTSAQTPRDLEQSRILTSVLSPYGYYPTEATADVRKLKPRDDPDFFAILDTINISAHRPALDALLATNTGATKLVVADMPISPMTARAIIHFGYDYQGYLNAVFLDAQASGVTFIPVPPPSLIDDDGFQDTIHMNTAGASIFSAWLGEQIGQMAQQGVLGSAAR